MASQSEVRSKFIQANPGVKRMGNKGYWYKCAHCGKWCGRPGRGNPADCIPANEKMEVDHIVPWSKGGSDALYNLQPLCRPCNRAKSNNPTFKDDVKATVNTITHPVDSLVKRPIKKAARQIDIFGFKPFGRK